MKRILTLLLGLVMVLGLCAVPAYADGAADQAIALYDSGDYTGAFQAASALATGDPVIALILGKGYYLGLGTDENHSKAMTYLEAASQGGCRSAAYLLAEAADLGYGVRMDKDEAARRYIKFVALADETDPAGRGVEKNHELALDAANKAAAAQNLTPFELMSLASFYDGPAPNHVSNAADATGQYAVETARKVDAAKADELYARARAGL